MSLMRRIRSVRSVLTLWYTTVLFVAMAIFGVTVYLYLERLLEATLERELAAEVEWIDGVLNLGKTKSGERRTIQEIQLEIKDKIPKHIGKGPRNYIMMITGADGNILYESENRAGRYLIQGHTDLDKLVFSSKNYGEDGALRIATLRHELYTISVAFSEKSIRVVLGHTLTIFGFLVPVVLIVSVSGGWVLAGMVMRPVKQITERAARITAHNLSERVPQRNVDDELGRLINTINYMITRLESSFNQMKEFSLNVAHELKTPLTILRGESELALAKAVSAEESQRLITMYLEETVRMSHIVDDLLTLAKGEAGQIVMQKTSVSIDELIQELYEDALILSTKKNLQVRLNENQRATVLGDSTRLRQLFRSLISNAVQYTDTGGAISISCKSVNHTVLVTVEDTGIGIPPESLNKIFERFYRVDEARSRVKGGIGLGLSLAKWIASSHNGRIEVRSTLGKGSSFIVHLPLSSSLPATS